MKYSFGDTWWIILCIIFVHTVLLHNNDTLNDNIHIIRTVSCFISSSIPISRYDTYPIIHKSIRYHQLLAAITQEDKQLLCNNNDDTVEIGIDDDDSMIEYIGEGKWDEEFIHRQQQLVPSVQIVTEMPKPTLLAPYHNRYFLLRHGESIANIESIISSNRTTLSYSNQHGLTNIGYQQAYDAAYHVLQCIQEQQIVLQQQPTNTSSHIDEYQHHRIIFVSSPFARARQTAYGCWKHLQELLQPMINPNTMDTNISSSSLSSISVHPSIYIHNLLVERYLVN